MFSVFFPFFTKMFSFKGSRDGAKDNPGDGKNCTMFLYIFVFTFREHDAALDAGGEQVFSSASGFFHSKFGRGGIQPKILKIIHAKNINYCKLQMIFFFLFGCVIITPLLL